MFKNDHIQVVLAGITVLTTWTLFDMYRAEKQHNAFLMEQIKTASENADQLRELYFVGYSEICKAYNK